MSQIRFSVNEAEASILAHIDAEIFELPALWLRERCQDEAHLDQITQQRLFDPHQLEDEISLLKVEKKSDMQYQLTFSDGYSGYYDFTEFFADFDSYDGAPTPIPWMSDTDKQDFYVDYDDLSSDNGMLKALETFLTKGALIVTNVPNKPDAVLDVASQFGQVRETNFGKYFEVYTRPNSNDLAYRSVPLGPHTDNPYRDPMPGIQLLHCIENQTSGGLSTLVDSLSVLEKLKKEDPEGYKLLCEVPVRYRYVEEDVELVERRTIIESDNTGKITGVTYSPRLDYLPLLPNDQLVIFHRARKRLGQLLSSPEFEWRFKLGPGQLQMFHNTRVLHGRTGFDASEGLRHLQGAYIDLDAPKGRYKAIKRQRRMTDQEGR
ncbi:MAG: TauD/TfdA family dioxygenase [Paraglaciecola sp.]|uniref:TauD/TfdA family dioxygenase n=1 Tax=Paraglaciecola sp. TaxID=1920173 RepID=UPI00328F20F4